MIDRKEFNKNYFIRLLDKTLFLNFFKIDETAGWTALMWASDLGNQEIVQMLLKHENIDVNQQNRK